MVNTAKWKIALIAAVVFVAGVAFAWANPLTVLKPQPTLATPVLFNEDAVTAIYNNASPAVVEISVTGTTGGSRSYFARGQGSGFLIDTSGDILTNNHVVDGATSVRVTFQDGSTADASVVGTDTIHDLALLRVGASAVSGITPLQLGDSSVLKPGQMAIALGAPFGLADSITVGVISGLNRSLGGSSVTGMIQTDAALNPGNSGGPLLNSQGEVVGVNTAIEAQSSARGIGFAVPSNVVKNALPSLSAGKTVQRAWLGVSVASLTADQANELGLAASRGAYIVSVVPGSPAEAAGIKGSGTASGGAPGSGGDLITAVDGKAIGTSSDLSSYLAGKQVGDTVTLTILRGGNTLTVQVKLGVWPSSQSIAPTPQPQPSIPMPWPWDDRLPRRVPSPRS